MAGGVSNGEENGFIFLLCSTQSFFSPRIPINGVVGVLEEIGAGFMD
jgi:hypothetical protein